MIYVLKTEQYNENDSSGLGTVARYCEKIGTTVTDGRGIDGKVFAPKMPTVSTEFLSPIVKNYTWTTFESSRIPDCWVRELNGFYRKVFVPHKAIRKVFTESGVTVPVEVVPQGFTRFIKKEKNKQTDSFVFGFLGVPTARKNVDKIIQATEELVNEGYDVVFSMHCCDLLPHSPLDIDKPFIEFSGGSVSYDSLSDWFATIDAYVYPSSGEGWSMTPRESMYLGIPTIISDIPVHDELVRSGFATVIPVARMTPTRYECFGNQQVGEWGVIEKEHIKQMMVAVMDNYEHCMKAAKRGQQWIQDKWNWDDVLEIIRQRIEED